MRGAWALLGGEPRGETRDPPRRIRRFGRVSPGRFMIGGESFLPDSLESRELNTIMRLVPFIVPFAPRLPARYLGGSCRGALRCRSG